MRNIQITGLISNRKYEVPFHTIRGIRLMTKEDIEENENYPDNFVRLVLNQKIKLPMNDEQLGLFDAIDVKETQEELNAKVTDDCFCAR